MITLSDVAKKANVSKMTVSRVINHPEQVTQELRCLVEQAMNDLNYHPNSIARALVHNRTNIIKFVILEDIDTTEPYYMNLLFGVAQGLNKRQYALQLVTSKNEMPNNCDGYIVTGARTEDYSFFDQINKPLVLFGENRQGYDFVDTDNQQGEIIATKYALKLHYQYIIFVGIDVKEPFEYSREAGYINTLQQNKIIPKIYRVPNHSRKAQDLINHHWDEFKANTCFICASDRIAIGIERALLQKNCNIPEDFGVIGFDGVFLDQISNPKLTTVKQQIFKIGEILASMILQKIKQSGSPQGNILVDPKLVKRGTTK